MPNGLPNPGSQEAGEMGCKCPVLANRRGTAPPFPPCGDLPEGGWYIRVDCTIHGDSYGVEEQTDRGQGVSTRLEPES